MQNMKKEGKIQMVNMCVCVCVCVSEEEREKRERRVETDVRLS